MGRVFLLSPAHAGGRRAALILNPHAQFPLARRLQRGEAAPLGEIYQFLSGLYFRGKLAYATAFAQEGAPGGGVMVITPNRGLLPADTPVTREELRQLGEGEIDDSNRRYREPLRRDLLQLAAVKSVEVVLLGSISTGKYANVLLEALGERVWFPTDFVGRGDMSRGGLLLRCVREGRELAYQRLAGAVRRGPRPPRLDARSG